MSKIKKLITALVILVTSFCFVPNANATKSSSDIKSYLATREYTIDNYDIDIKVNENRTFDITEKIEANFNVNKHGIFRSIPLHGELKRQDGSVSKYHARITDIKVSEEFTKEYEDGNLKLKIGSSKTTNIGKREYVISYTYNMGEDPLTDIDEFYFNLIGTEWDTTISDVSFTIEMPKDFDETKIGISTGSYGSTGTDMVSYTSYDRKIYGQTIGTLKAYEGITIRIELPEGYFVGAGIEISPFIYGLYTLPVIFFIIIAYLWNKYGKDRKTFIKPEYFPPKGANSLDVGFLYKGSANSKDVLSLLIYLANKGYLTIEETEEKGFLSNKKGFILKKVKNYDGNNENEKTFFEGLFKSKKEVKSADLYDKFYKTTQKIISNTNKAENKNKIFEKRGGIIAITVLMVAVSMVAISVPPFIDMGDSKMLIFSVVFPGLGFSLLIRGIIGLISTKQNTEKALYVFLIIWGAMFGGVPFLVFVLPELMYEQVYIIGYIVGMIFIIGQIVFIQIMPKRTEYGTKIFAEIEGFKDFLISVEKDRIEKMVEQYPNYFFDILPYAYVLGVSDKWIKKFESINLKAPNWYTSTTAFNMTTFDSFITSTMSTANSTMGSSASHSSGGSGGGGGFSGGGGGGGGGGSW